MLTPYYFVFESSVAMDRFTSARDNKAFLSLWTPCQRGEAISNIT